MENENNEAATDQSFFSLPRRRRSTFFERRDSFAPLCQNRSENDEYSNVKIDEGLQEDLTRYSEKLTSEKQQWKNEVVYKRNKYHDLREEFKVMQIASGESLMSYSLLSADDIELLKGRTNISNYVDEQMKLQKSISEIVELNKMSNEIDNFILKQNEDEIKRLTMLIIEKYKRN